MLRLSLLRAMGLREILAVSDASNTGLTPGEGVAFMFGNEPVTVLLYD